MIWGLFLNDLPNIRDIENGNFAESTVFYDAEGNEYFRYGENGKRIYVNYDQISQSIIDALVSAEDQGFFENPGIDFLGLARAGFYYITGKRSQVQGTSTLSQQLIKNTLLTNERSIKRKIQEAYLAYQLNQTYSKEKILEMYLNLIEFGHGANGVEQASLTFFGKSAKDVGPLGATILASLPKSPTAFSPYSKREKSRHILQIHQLIEFCSMIWRLPIQNMAHSILNLKIIFRISLSHKKEIILWKSVG